MRPRLEPLEARELLDANIWTVNTTADTDTGDPTKQTGSLRYCCLNAPSNATIVFSTDLAGQTIQLFTPIRLGENGASNVTIDGGTNHVIINGGGSTRLFESLPGLTYTINNLTLTNGTTWFSANNPDGAAVLVDENAFLYLSGDTFSNNQARTENNTGSGGAIANLGTVIINGTTTFTNNSAAVNGGAIENLGVLGIYGGANALVNFTTNTAGQNGGAILSNSGQPGQANLTVQFASFATNTASGGDGGAINTSDELSASNDSFSGNRALVGSDGTGGDGGGIDTSNAATISTSVFIANTAADNGGAIYSVGGSNQLTISGSQFTNQNSASSGDGGAIDTYNPTSITDSEFTSNGAAGYGGAIANEAMNTLNVYGTAFNTNQSRGSGGAIENFGVLLVTSSLASRSVFNKNVAGTNGGAIDSNAQKYSTLGQLHVFYSDLYGNNAPSGAGGAVNTADNTLLSNDNFNSTNFNAPNFASTAGGAVNATGGPNGSSVLNVDNNSLFMDNYVTGNVALGGAIFTSANTSVKLSTFRGNTATAQGFENGGAIAYVITNIPGSSLLLDLDTFDSNKSHLAGGAVYTKVSVNSGTTAVSITNSTFVNNTADTGGGGVDVNHYTTGDASASANFVNDTFFDNNAGFGGGIAFDDLTNDGTGTNTAALTSLTVNNNKATQQGGGVYVAKGNVEVTNNIFDGNQVTDPNYTGPQDVFLVQDTNATLTDRGFNLVGTSDEVDGFNVNDDDIITDNPGLALALAQNGAPQGYPQTLAPTAGSPAVGNGNSSLAGTTDERGKTRQDPVSIGAEDPNAT